LSQRIKGFDKLNKSPEQIFKLRLRTYIEEKRNNPVQQIGFPTGFQIWDRLIGGGLRSPSVNVVVARQKMGKSSFLATVACNLAKLGIPVLMLDTEMGEDEAFSRMTAAISKVPITEIETGQFIRNLDKDRRVGEAVSLLESLPYYYINIAGQPFEETLTEIRRWLTKVVGLDEKGHAKECVIILDYLKIMSKDSIRNMAEHQEFGFMTTSLVNSTIRYKFPCLTSGQTNRDGINTEDMSVVAGSDRIGWFATNVSLFKPHSAEELLAQRQSGIRIPFNRKLINLVARHGPGNDEGDWINLRFNRDICHIEEGPLQSVLTTELEENQGGFSQDGEQQEF
jgi:archaellum biogenesis ATPase FlaH